MIDLEKKKAELENKLDALYEEQKKLEAKLELVEELIEEEKETATETNFADGVAVEERAI